MSPSNVILSGATLLPTLSTSVEVTSFISVYVRGAPLGRYSVIMPLTRTAGGQLGVRAVGGAGGAPVTYIDVHIDSNGQSSSNVRGDEQNGRELGRMIEGAVNDVLIRQMQPGGLLYSGRTR